LREIVLLAPSSVLSSEEAGLVTRFVVGALLLSHSARTDVRVIIFFDGERCVSFEGNSMKNVRPDEQSLSGILRTGLRRIVGAGGGRVMQGINAYSKPFKEYLKEVKHTKLFYGGAGGKVTNLPSDFVAVFQYPGMSRLMEDELCRQGFLSMHLSERTLFPDQAVVVLNNVVDRMKAKVIRA
jgi:tRNA pseudouridine-54 N-methylase